MRRITLWLLSTVSILVLLFSYHTSTSSAVATSIHAPGTTGPDAATKGPAASPGTPAPTDSTGVAGASGTYTGTAVSTEYGDVQVQITVQGGRVTASTAVQVPWDNARDRRINSNAVPILNGEAVAAQSAQIDMVSGATYTSQGYVESLQAALDQAHL